MDNYESEFSKKNILITGASSGVGLYSAFYFLNQNANVILACQDEISVIKLLEKYNFKNAYILKADLEKLGQIKTFINYITEIFTNIDILINCAGIKLDNDILTTHSEDFDYTMNTNLRSVFILIKELRPYFSQGASIINMSCMYGTKPMCGFISYSMSKAGLETLTKYAAAEMAYLNIRINAISACPINTNSLRYINISEKEIKEFNKKMEKNIPLGRIAEGDDIVKVIIFLASKRSKKITGQIIKVDGGRGLTSSGYVHYKGLFNMNSKIEPDKDIILQSGDICYNLCEKNKIMDKPITDKNELKKFVETTIKNSNFSTRNMEAFYNVKNDYYQVENNNNLLSQKFLTDESKNELLKLNSEKEIEYDIKNVNINCYNNDNININENKINNNKSIKMSENIELKPYDEEIFIHGKENIDENEIQNQNK
jgi:3-oxoacyl-[acyl-carrier protein] reductase